MPTGGPQPGKKPYRFIGQMEVDPPSLALQERTLLKLTGGLFPERKHDFCGFKRVLDVTCGAGSWALTVARENPHLEVISVTTHEALVTYAQEQARAADLNNVHFMLMAGNERLQLPFFDEDFEMVNTQYLYLWLHTDEWADFVRDCWRVTRPGGYLRMTEPERGQSTSLAFAHLEDLCLQAMEKNGLRFSPDDRHIGLANQLLYLCQETGWSEITRRAYISDYGEASDPQKYSFLCLQLHASTLWPLILQENLACEEELTALLQQVKDEMERDEFAANCFSITVGGRKLEESGRAEM